MHDLGTMALRPVEEAKGMEEIEERVAGLVCELGRTIRQALYAHLDQKLMRKREKGLRNMGILPACFSGNGAGTCIR